MGGDEANLEVELLAGRCHREATNSGSLQLGDDVAIYSQAKLQQDVESFSLQQATCFTNTDTERLHAVVEAGGGGLDGLARFIQERFLDRVARVSRPSQASSRPSQATRISIDNADQRKELFAEAKNIGGYDGAVMLHQRLPARYWGVNKEQFKEFVDAVRLACATGKLTNTNPNHLPEYADARFQMCGPTVHQVNTQFIMPQTDGRAQILPFASYAVAQNSDQGCDCDLFISHCWDEGVSEFGEVVSQAWPEECSGSYVCFLANPQHLDIASLVSSPRGSPFFKVLQAKPKMMLMVSNRNIPIHSRLWCVYEAKCAKQLSIPTKIAGDPLWLVPANQRDQARHVLNTLGDGDADGRLLETVVAEMGIKVKKAKCYSRVDRARIWEDIGPHAEAVNMMIKELIIQTFLNSHTSHPDIPELASLRSP